MSQKCIDKWVEAFNALDPSAITEGFDETSPLVTAVQAECPFDDGSQEDRSAIFRTIDDDVRQALADAGFIRFVPLGSEVK